MAGQRYRYATTVTGGSEHLVRNKYGNMSVRTRCVLLCIKCTNLRLKILVLSVCLDNACPSGTTAMTREDFRCDGHRLAQQMMYRRLVVYTEHHAASVFLFSCNAAVANPAAVADVAAAAAAGATGGGVEQVLPVDGGREGPRKKTHVYVYFEGTQTKQLCTFFVGEHYDYGQ